MDELDTKETNEMMGQQNSNQFGIFAAGLTLGGIIGAGIALLLAPHSGEETRTMISDKSNDLVNQINKQVNDMRSQAEQGMDSAQQKVSDTAQNVSDTAQDAAQKVSDRAHNIGQG
jgi:gas vesicle protein